MTANRCIPKLKSTENMLYLFAAVYQKTGADERSAPVFLIDKSTEKYSATTLCWDGHKNLNDGLRQFILQNFHLFAAMISFKRMKFYAYKGTD